MNVKPDLDWSEANQLLHAVANVLTEEQRAVYYDAVQDARYLDSPNDLVQKIFSFITGNP